MSQAPKINRRWVLSSYPVGEAREGDFTMESVDIPAPSKGQVRARMLGEEDIRTSADTMYVLMIF